MGWKNIVIYTLIAATLFGALGYFVIGYLFDIEVSIKEMILKSALYFAIASLLLCGCYQSRRVQSVEIVKRVLDQSGYVVKSYKRKEDGREETHYVVKGRSRTKRILMGDGSVWLRSNRKGKYSIIGAPMSVRYVIKQEYERAN